MSFHSETCFRREAFPELKLWPWQTLPGCGDGNASEIAAGMRQARHETETETIAGRMEQLLEFD